MVENKQFTFFASVAELVDALDLKSNWYLNASAGSSPARGTLNPCKSIVYDLRGFFISTYASNKEFFGDNRGTTDLIGIPVIMIIVLRSY